MSKSIETKKLSRRSFVKGASLTALAAAAGSGASLSLFGCASTDTAEKGAAPAGEKIVWSICGSQWGCGLQKCPIKHHVVDGTIAYVEGDNIGDSSFGGDVQARACLRGRSTRRWINSPDRLKYPMKRVGKRGDGEFERISWDEAMEILIEKYRYTLETYGNEAIYSNFTSEGPGNWRPFERFNNLTGGRLDYYGTDSYAQLDAGMTYLYGPWTSAGSPFAEARANADLIVMFGSNPAETRMGGGSAVYDFALARAAGIKIVIIDCRLSETASAHPEEWIPIRSGTDAALASAISYVLITEGLADEDFLHTYCIGYDESTMPEGAPANSSYKDYILGTGYDMTAKTPEWAAPITLIPAEKIYELAREIGNAKAAFITQGWGPQRHSNGENACRAIAMVAIMSGNVGRPGTCGGLYEALTGGLMTHMPGGVNPVTTKISIISRIDAIDHGDQMTALRDGVRGKDKLDVGIKFMMNFGTNALVNQQMDINHTHDVLVDESKCEFICCVDVVMTPDCRYADLLLPDAMRQEGVYITEIGGAGLLEGVLFGQPVQEPQFECRDWYEVCRDLAEAFGVRDAYTEGHETWEDWQHALYEEARARRSDLPTLEEGIAMGFWKAEAAPFVWASGFVDDPVANPLGTPSGKIEIYSESLAEIAATWELDDPRDIISPIPIYNPGVESYEDTTEEYPLTLSGWHPKARYNSSHAANDLVAQQVRQQLWINPVDAEPRGIKNGDMVRLYNMRGEMHIEARVTPRIVPGNVGMPEGAWFVADMNGDRIDKGGNMNILTSSHFSPLAKGNSANSSIVQVEKL